jgi:hypothetical protein
MSKRYKSRRTLTGEPTGKRVRWLTISGRKASLSKSVVNKDFDREFQTELVALNHVFGIYEITADGLKYVAWTGQVGVCKVKGERRHCVAGNLFVNDDPARVVIYSMFVPFGLEAETAAGYAERINNGMARPLLQWMPPAGAILGRVQLKSFGKEISAGYNALKATE